MPDKSLTESAWKTFVKSAGASYKDTALVKALAAFEKAEKSGPAAELEALDDLAKQADLVRKAGKGDKKLGDFLDGLDKALDKQRKTSEQALKDEKKGGGDEEEDSPALLTTKLVPLLREVRKGDTVLQTLIAIAGKDTAVLLSRKAISPVRGKLLKEYLGASGAIKFIRGECIFEANAHTFVVQSQAAGLAKKLKAALLAQTELRVKVRVRGEDPDDLDEDGDDGEEDSQQGNQKEGADTTADAPPGSVPPAPPTPQQTAFEARLAQLEPLVQRALQAQAGDVSRIRAVAAFAREKGEAGTWAAGLQALDQLQKLLDAPATPTSTPTPTGGDPAAAFNARLAALMPRVKEAIAGQHPQAADIRLKVSEAGTLARKKEFKPADALLDAAQSLLDAKPVDGGSDGGNNGDAPVVDRGKAFKARLAAMQDAIRTAMTGPLAAQLRPLVATVAGAKTDLDAADTALDAIENLLARPSPTQTQQPPTPSGTDGDAAGWGRRLAAIEDRFNTVLAGNPADATRLRATMAVATEQAEAGNHADAIQALDRLAQLLDAAEGTADAGLPKPGVVAYRSALLAFKSAFGTVQSQLQALKSAIPQQLPDEAELADELQSELQSFNDELQDAVDAAMTAAQDDAAPVTRDLADTLAAYRQQLDDHALVRHVDNNPFGVQVSVGQLLGDALRKIVQTMPEVA